MPAGRPRKFRICSSEGCDERIYTAGQQARTKCVTCRPVFLATYTRAHLRADTVYICGNEQCFLPYTQGVRSGRDKKYCSRACCQALVRAAAALRPKPAKALCEVDGCDKPIQAKKLCATHYGRLQRHGDSNHDYFAVAREKRNTICPQCESSFYSKRTRTQRRGVYCSTPCRALSRRVHTDAVAERRAHTQVRAAREKTGKIGPVRKLDIFERDGWTCYLCAKPTLRPPYEWRQAAAPSLDHATPLAKGGTHTPDNLITAHRGCNTKKGTRDWLECMEEFRCLPDDQESRHI